MLHMFQQPVKHHIVSCAAHVTKGGSAQMLRGTSCTPEFVMQPGLTDARPMISPDLQHARSSPPRSACPHVSSFTQIAGSCQLTASECAIYFAASPRLSTSRQPNTGKVGHSPRV
jgi:hypothetical protein